MIDIHCHILPGIDDGAPDLSVSMEMARQAVKDGITHIAATPHFRHPIVPGEQLERREQAAMQLRQEIKKEELPLEIILGGEFQVNEYSLETLQKYPEILYQREKQDAPCAVLLELPPEADVLRAGDVLFQYQISRNAPELLVIAHPERQPGFLEHAAELRPLMDQGLCLQFNVMTFVRSFWLRKYIRVALALMEYAPSQVYLATDAHDSVRRDCRMTPARKVIARTLGEEFWQKLTVDNPKKLLGLA